GGMSPSEGGAPPLSPNGVGSSSHGAEHRGRSRTRASGPADVQAMVDDDGVVDASGALAGRRSRRNSRSRSRLSQPTIPESVVAEAVQRPTFNRTSSDDIPITSIVPLQVPVVVGQAGLTVVSAMSGAANVAAGHQPANQPVMIQVGSRADQK